MATDSKVSINPLGKQIGAELVGVDLAEDVSDATFAEIEAALAEWSVLVFRDQKIGPAQQLAFAEHFGGLEINSFSQHAMEDHPSVLKLSNVVEDGKPLGYADAGSFWHTDMSYTKTPPRLTMLYAIEIPRGEDGNSLGDTLFASAIAAYDALDVETRQRIDTMKAVHDTSAKKRGVKKAVEVSAEQVNSNPPVSHPIARTHPLTGRKAIYVTADECTGIEGLADEDALPLLQRLSDHVVRPEFQYHHKWRVGDLLMWDNCAVQHVVKRDYEWPPHRRILHRITVNGTVPY